MTQHLATLNRFAIRLTLIICCISIFAGAQSSELTAVSLKGVPGISVTPNRSGARFTRIALQSAGFSASNVTVKELLDYAYGIKPYALVGAPDWLATARFDVQVTESQAETAAFSPAQIQEHRKLLVRLVLANAFQLKFHTVHTVVAGYSLIPDSSGVRIAMHDPQSWSTGRITNNNGQIDMTALPISSLADQLSEAMGAPVVDRTRLTGNYDASLWWDKNSTADNASETYAALASAVRDQLGLSLVPGDQEVEKFVIDKIAPAGN
jgi:uncharacterized protein (TIGR03435 family)